MAVHGDKATRQAPHAQLKCGMDKLARQELAQRMRGPSRPLLELLIIQQLIEKWTTQALPSGTTGSCIQTYCNAFSSVTCSGLIIF
jgi:hypothetical protein